MSTDSLRVLFLDLNSYFASVEQQVQPALRGRPIAVAPITSDAGCCIAASIEAKRHGVKTGMRVRDARDACPDIAIVDARPRLYVRMHERIHAAVDAVIPVHRVHSIDEFSCRLDPSQRSRDAAERTALAVKDSIRRRCGVTMRCSVGLAPNRVLAKLGTDLKKPDGLFTLEAHDLPHAIAHLRPQELAGIGPRLMNRLDAAGVRTIGDLARRSEGELRHLWGGILGERWFHWLRGRETFEPRTRRSTVGHQHVLAPSLRTGEGARAVAYRLLLKACARLRFDSLAARTLTLGLDFEGSRTPGSPAGGWGGTSWAASASLGDGADDSPTLLGVLAELWRQTPLGTPVLVAVTLSDLVLPQSRTLPLFPEEQRRAALSAALDAVNRKFGANVLYPASIHHARQHATGGIAFASVPNLALADSVQSRQRGESHLLSDEAIDDLLDASLAAR